MKPWRLLYVNGGTMDLGGISTFMMNYYRNIDRTKLQIDFVVHGYEKGIYDDEIMQMGGKIFHIPIKSKDYFGNIKKLRNIIKANNYIIVHSHMDAMNSHVLKIAKDCGVTIRISHSHNTSHITKSKIKILLNEISKKKIKNYATHLFACSDDAARWLYGDKIVDDKKVEIIPNAVDIEKYLFNYETRNKIRAELNIAEDDFVIGHIGRFDYQKNHEFILNLFSHINANEKNVKLILVGDGHLRKKINKKIVDLKIENNVILLGYRQDVSDIFNAFDTFVLPSNFEGLGMVLIEAQISGLYCVASTNVPEEVNILNKVKFLNLSKGNKQWKNEIFDNAIRSNNRRIEKKDIEKTGYDIQISAKKLQEMYIHLIKQID